MAHKILPYVNLDAEEEKFILEQIKYMHNEMVGIQQAFLGSISLPLGIYAVAVYYTYQSDYREHLFSILPFLFSLSIFNILKYTIKMLGIDAYIRYLEELINASRQKNIFMWQTYLVHTNSYSLIGGLCQLPAFLALGFFILVQFWNSVYSLDSIINGLSKIFQIALFIDIIALFITALGTLTQYHAVLYWCENINFNITNKNKNKLANLNTSLPYIAIIVKEKLTKWLHI